MRTQIVSTVILIVTITLSNTHPPSSSAQAADSHFYDSQLGGSCLEDIMDRNIMHSIALLAGTLIIGFFVITTVIPTFTALRDRVNTINTTLNTALTIAQH